MYSQTMLADIKNRGHELLIPAQHHTYICPFCGSGTGHHHTGMSEDKRDGHAGHFKCWRCGFYGDIIDIIQKTQSVPFHEAVAMAASDLGITIEEERR